MVSAHASLCALSKNPRCGKIAHQVFCVLSKILYGRGYALRLRALFFELAGPGFALGPTLPMYHSDTDLNRVLLPKGSVETVPSLSSCRESGSPWVTGQDLATILGTWRYPLKGIVSYDSKPSSSTLGPGLPALNR